MQQGDTIWKISKKFGVSPQRIIADNGLAFPNRIAVGQALLILFPDQTYTIKAGDNLLTIADKYNTTVNSLIRNNPELILDTVLNIGQTITINFKNKKEGSIVTNGYAYPFINWRVLMRTLPYLTKLTIFGYGFTENGDLINIDDEPLIRMAYQFNVAPIMLLSSLTEEGNFSGLRANYLFNNINAQNALIMKIINTMKYKGYLGIDIDFEYINQQDAQAYLDFLTNITKQLKNEGFSVNVDLAPKISSTQRGLLYEAHNYPKIGEIADTVLLMTYEWGYTYGPPMAVAPLNQVRKVIEYAVTEIPSNKILMGIPVYGYNWLLPYIQGVSQATSIGNDFAATIAFNNKAVIKYDDTAQSPYFNYWDRQGREHVVWFEDVRSIKSKLELLKENNLLGAGYWSIMRPFIPNWTLTNAMFNIKKII